MLDWFKKFNRGNVIKFPEPKEVPKIPYVEPPTPEPSARVFYRLGVTDKNLLALQLGPMEITMTKAGVQNLIEQLQVFRDQLDDEDEQ